MNRYKNQKGLIDNERLARTPIIVVGAGAIGSRVVVDLSKMGARDITVYDFDTLEDHNFSSQMYPTSKLGMAKVHALESVAHEYGDCKITAINEPWTPDNAKQSDDSGILLSCVDNMDVRSALFKFYKSQAGFFVDGRMSAYVFSVYAVATKDGRQVEHYEKSLFPQSEGSQEPCGQKSIIYTVGQVASQMVSQVRAWTMNEQYRPVQVTYDTYNDEIFKVYTMEREIEVVKGDLNEEAASDAGTAKLDNQIV